MEGRDNFDFSVSEGGVESPSPSLTPSPVSTPSPSAGAGTGRVRANDGSGRGIELAAVSSAFLVEGMNIALGKGKGIMGTSRDGGAEEELGRKKSGSPRKYEPDVMALGLTPRSSSPFSPATDFSGKRGRGRPRGSGKRQLLAALGEWFTLSAGRGFTPHVVTVAAGEDVAARILSFSQIGPRAICILSANGSISNVTLRQPGASEGILTFEGRFEILSLSGSFTIINTGGIRSRTGGLSVSLAGPDGRVIGGGVAGLLLAASPIQVVVGSFMPNAFKEQRRNLNSEPSEPLSFSPKLTAATQISQTTLDEERETPNAAMMVPNNSNDRNNSNNYPNLNPPSFQSVRWQGLQPPSELKPSPDINLCSHGE